MFLFKLQKDLVKFLVVTVGPDERTAEFGGSGLEALVTKVNKAGRAARNTSVGADLLVVRLALVGVDTVEELAVHEVGLLALFLVGESLFGVSVSLVAVETAINESEHARALSGTCAATHSNGTFRALLVDHGRRNSLAAVFAVNVLTSLGGASKVQSTAVNISLGHIFELTEDGHHLEDVVGVAQIGVINLDERSKSLDEQALVGSHFKHETVTTEDLGAGTSSLIENVAGRASLRLALLGNSVENGAFRA